MYGTEEDGLSKVHCCEPVHCIIVTDTNGIQVILLYSSNTLNWLQVVRMVIT